MTGRLVSACLVLCLLASAARAQDAPRILLDQPARIVEYQLNRLTDEQLLAVERRDTDARYRPIYLALLTRPRIDDRARGEALAALAKLDGVSAVAVLMDVLGRVAADDVTTVGSLVGVLASQTRAALETARPQFVATVGAADEPAPRVRGAYAGLLATGDDTAGVWNAARARDGHLPLVLTAILAMPPTMLRERGVGVAIAPFVAEALEEITNGASRPLAARALAHVRPAGPTVAVLSAVLRGDADAATRAAAVGALATISDRAVADDDVSRVASGVTAWLRTLTAEERAEPAAVDALQLGERLARRLAPEPARLLRRELRALGVRVVRIETLPEMVSFDVRWFAVEAGKPAQVVLVNPDAMPHNLVIGRPGSLEAIATAGAALPMPTDPTVKAFVPDLPSVLFSTRLLKQGETERLAFVAPTEPGEYVFVCTFPGHWVRMYGVMLVVADLDAWEASPTRPTDPMTRQPFAAAGP